MTLKEYITSGYGAGTYRKTLMLKEAKKNNRTEVRRRRCKEPVENLQ